jgi:hypothetical protein
MPLFNFYYHIPYVLGSLFVAAGLSLTLAFKLSLFLSFIFSGCFMYLFTYTFFKDRDKALVATLLYQFAPFHLVDMVVRGDIGEILAMTFLPLVLYFVTKIFSETYTRKYVFGMGVSTALMILSHSAIGLMYFATVVLFILFLAPNASKRITALFGLGIGLLLTAFFWIPVLYERKYTYGDYFMKDMYKSHFTPVWNFFIPNPTNSKSLQTGGVDISFGLMQTIALIVGVWQLFKSKLTKHIRLVIYVSLMLTAAALFVMTSPSSFLWGHISILRAFQFPWRYLNIIVFSLSFLGGAVLIQKNTPKWIFISIIAVTLLTSYVYWRPPLGFDRIDEKYFWNYPLDTTFFGETNVIWSAGPAGSYPKNRFELIAGKGQITEGVKQQTKHTFTVTAQTNVQILDNTQYYPGWRVYSDNAKIPIEFQDQNHRGMITFHLPPGIHHVTVSFGETPVRMASDIMTVVAVIVTACALLLPQRKKAKSV